MAGQAARYRETLRTLIDWDAFLLQESGLPGPRANLELVQVVADAGDLIVLAAFSAANPQFDAARLEAIRFYFDGAQGGEVYLDQIGFRREK
jgi:hypothetical protein